MNLTLNIVSLLPVTRGRNNCIMKSRDMNSIRYEKYTRIEYTDNSSRRKSSRTMLELNTTDFIEKCMYSTRETASTASTAIYESLHRRLCFEYQSMRRFLETKTANATIKTYRLFKRSEPRDACREESA